MQDVLKFRWERSHTTFYFLVVLGVILHEACGTDPRRMPYISIPVLLLMLYSQLIRLFNTTIYSISDIGLHLKTGPFLKDEQTFPAREIKNIRISEQNELVLETTKGFISLEYEHETLKEAKEVKKWLEAKLSAEFSGRPMASQGPVLRFNFPQKTLTSSSLKLRWKNSWISIFLMLTTSAVAVGSIFFFLDFINYSPVLNDVPFLLIPLGITVMALYKIYFCLTGWVNHSTIQIAINSVRVDCGPLPWKFPHRQMAKSEINQIYAREYKLGHRSSETYYELVVCGHDDTEMVFHNRIASKDEALILEKWLESKLEIQDEHIQEEVKGKYLFKA